MEGFHGPMGGVVSGALKVEKKGTLSFRDGVGWTA